MGRYTGLSPSPGNFTAYSTRSLPPFTAMFSSYCSGERICCKIAPSWISPTIPRVFTFERTFFRSPTPAARFCISPSPRVTCCRLSLTWRKDLPIRSSSVFCSFSSTVFRISASCRLFSSVMFDTFFSMDILIFSSRCSISMEVRANCLFSSDSRRLCSSMLSRCACDSISPMFFTLLCTMPMVSCRERYISSRSSLGRPPPPYPAEPDRRPDLVRISRMITSTTSISSVLHTPISNMFICLYPVVFIVFRRAFLVQERIRILVFIVGIIGVDDIQFMKLFVESFSLFLHRPENLIVFGILQRLFLSLFL